LFVRDYNSLIFGSEIAKSPQAANICKLEFNFILSIYQIHLLLSLKEVDLAKKVNSPFLFNSSHSKLFRPFRNLILAKSLSTISLNSSKTVVMIKATCKRFFVISPHFQSIGRFNTSISSFIDTHANILFSFAKAYYVTKNLFFLY